MASSSRGGGVPHHRVHASHEALATLSSRANRPTCLNLEEEERVMSFTWSPSVAMNRDEIDRFLRRTLVARLTSIRPDGYPHTTPLWYVWDGEALWFEIGAGARPRQHLRNFRSNPKLCVMIDRDARPEHGGVF